MILASRRLTDQSESLVLPWRHDGYLRHSEFTDKIKGSLPGLEKGQERQEEKVTFELRLEIE